MSLTGSPPLGEVTTSSTGVDLARLREARERIAGLSERPDIVAVDPAVVHKQRDVNVLIGDLEQHTTEPAVFGARVVVRQDHPFFYDHPLDHVPGMLIVEAARQAGMALCHVYYDVPIGHLFVLSSMQIEFTRFAELGSSPDVLVAPVNVQRRRGALAGFRSEGICLQDDKVVAFLAGDWQIVDPRVAERLRRHAQ